MTARHSPPAARHPDELLYESAQTRVVRRYTADGRSLVFKETLGPHALERLRRERRILAVLAGIAGTPQLAAGPHSDAALVLEDRGGISLARALLAGPQALPPLVPLALWLAHIVAAMHRAGVLHQDIHPGNILLCGPQREPELIDFHLATTSAEEQPAFNHHREIAGTLPYLAPEQTGRTGRTVDQRADLYALGATLYELATGRPPFDAVDPLQLIHAHLVEIPAPPIAHNLELPRSLSDIILRLLAKEPDARYQSAQGLGHDLGRLQARLEQGDDRVFPLGERDFAARLPPPSQLVGRQTEIAGLQRAFEKALTGGPRGVLVSGAPGVGKTALLNELRPWVAARHGWFISGKFDRQRQDLASDGVYQALRALGRLLLAEPEGELQTLRARLVQTLGTHGCRLVAQVPEFAVLLGEQSAVAEIDPLSAKEQIVEATLGLLRAIASPARPLVMVVDDLQWAAPLPIAIIHAVLTDDSLRGLLVVGAYRDADLEVLHPLAGMLPRWARLDSPPLMLTLKNLPPADVAALLAETLRLALPEAARLAEAVSARTDGNPFDTVEFVNALRRDGALVLGDDGWTWDAAAIHRHIGHGNVIDLLVARIAALPPETRDVLGVMACLGGEVELPLLQAASGAPLAALEQQLAPALEDGLLMMRHEAPAAVRFRHDRVQQASLERLGPALRERLHLALAQRLAALPEFEAQAAHQYLPALEAIDNPPERLHAAELLCHAARTLRTFNPATAERFLSGAVALLDRAGRTQVALLPLHIERHALLYHLGRLDEANAVYHTIERHGEDPLQLADAACVQICGLTNQGRPREAVALGDALLRRLGLDLPSAEELGFQLAGGSEVFSCWLDPGTQASDLQRPDASDPRALAAGRLLNRMVPPSFFCDPASLAGLVLTGQRLWIEHGPAAEFVGSLSPAAVVTIGMWQDYRTGRAIVRHLLTVSEARGYHRETAQARFMWTVSCGPWANSQEDNAIEAGRAREGLLQWGDLQEACYSHYASLYSLIDCAPTLERYAAEIETALAFSTRTGNDHAAASFVSHRQLARMLRGDGAGRWSFDDASFSEVSHLANLGADTLGTFNFHVVRALGAALAGDGPALIRHAALAIELQAAASGNYLTLLAQLLQALALAQRLREGAPAERGALQRELDACHDWLAGRAADAPFNYLHLLHWIDAERAWALDDFRAASLAFDAAMHAADPHQRPWHKALISERAALFLLEQGLQRSGAKLMAEARQRYAQWGADAKVHALDRTHVFLHDTGRPRSQGDHQSSNGVTGHSIDLLGVLRASQALSSETHLDSLKTSVVTLLGTLTGATSVRFALWNDDQQQWLLSATSDEPIAPMAIDDAGARGLLPLSVFRYAERTREPLLLGDATRDDRFMHDPYLAALERCSLLVVPILSRGALRAMLLLENRLGRHAFSADRLESVILIGGQLAVSLDNALLYASLEQKVAERTEALEAANRQLAALSLTDALTGVANRRRFDEVLKAEWQRALRQGTSLGAAIIDIDHFKRYNDHYGHPAGDACLRQVAQQLRQCLRQDNDLLARYGGEEFALILPGTNAAAAHEAAERARAAVAAMRTPHAQAELGIVTVSIGVAARVATDRQSPQALVDAADAALYQAKRQGRNRVERDPLA